MCAVVPADVGEVFCDPCLIPKRHSQSTANRAQPKAVAKAARVVRVPALAPRKRRLLARTHRMAPTDGPWAPAATGVDAGTGTTPAIFGLQH